MSKSYKMPFLHPRHNVNILHHHPYKRTLGQRMGHPNQQSPHKNSSRVSFHMLHLLTYNPFSHLFLYILLHIFFQFHLLKVILFVKYLHLLNMLILFQMLHHLNYISLFRFLYCFVQYLLYFL